MSETIQAYGARLIYGSGSYTVWACDNGLFTPWFLVRRSKSTLSANAETTIAVFMDWLDANVFADLKGAQEQEDSP